MVIDKSQSFLPLYQQKQVLDPQAPEVSFLSTTRKIKMGKKMNKDKGKQLKALQ